MGLKTFKPYTKSTRGTVVIDKSSLWKGTPYKPLTKGQNFTGGRNNNGRITSRHIGGGSKHKYRIIDFYRKKKNVPAVVERIEYDPNRTGYIALITYKDKEKAYNLALTLSKDSIKTIEDFRLFVNKYSYDKKTKKIGGDLGWITPDNFNVPEIGEAIKYINMNECSPPINSSLGFHLLWIESVKKGGRPNKDDHWPELEEMALNKKKMDLYETWIQDVKKRFYIKEISN